MKFLTKILSCIFSLITILTSVPNSNLPKTVLRPLREENVIYSDESFALEYEKGNFSLSKKGVTMFKDAVSEFKLGEKIISSSAYESFEIQKSDVRDSRGTGKKITVLLKKSELPDMIQSFVFYEGEKYFTVNLELVSEGGIVSSNYIAPVVVRNFGFQNENPLYTNFLEVPFDNDNWVKFTTKRLSEDGLAHEVGAFFTPDCGDGFIIGSLTHDKWKSAVSYVHEKRSVKELYAYSGANTPLTRDQSPHGEVKGERISSAVFFFGFYENWKEGMNEFARINTTFTPKRKSVISSNPIGWNSWGSIQDKISYDSAIGTSDYIKNNLQDSWKDEENVVFLNLDSYWDNLTDEEMKSFVRHCEENGQSAGIYTSPFILWWDEYGMKNNYVPGTNILYNDIRLKKKDGTYYGNDIDGCYPMDVTNPATYIHFKTQLQRLMSCGFKYIKLDFLVHGSLEGDYYDKSIETGIEAYNYAMSKVAEIVGDDVFINLSMAPIFPYCYANGRRLACDAFYDIGATEYTLNALTYGFWQSELYDYIDPDHIVIWGKDAKASEKEAKSRLLSGIICGGSFLAGDNFVNPAGKSDKAFERYEKLLTNEKLIELLKKGKPFEGKIDSKCAETSEIFTLKDEGKTYVAVINYKKITTKTYLIEVPGGKTAENLFTGEKIEMSDGKLPLVLSGKDCAIFEITQ